MTAAQRFTQAGALVVILAACGRTVHVASPPPAASPDWRAFVGCYHGEAAAFALDSVRVDPNDSTIVSVLGGGKLRARMAADDASRGAASFWWVERDSVRVVHTDGFTGMSGSFVARGDSLIGLVQDFTDVVPPPGFEPPAQRVALRRVRCPDTP